MHKNLSEKEYLVLNLAIQNQREQYLEDIEKFGKSQAMSECLSILESVEEKCLHQKSDKDIINRTATETTIGYTLKEAQSMYIALYMFRAQCQAMCSNNIFEDMPEYELKNSPIGQRDLAEYINISTEILTPLEESFITAGINISDFFTIHDNEESFYRATGQRIKGAERNSPCPCGSGKKYKNCCGRFH